MKIRADSTATTPMLAASLCAGMSRVGFIPLCDHSGVREGFFYGENGIGSRESG
jgi:hypothetical protein